VTSDVYYVLATTWSSEPLPEFYTAPSMTLYGDAWLRFPPRSCGRGTGGAGGRCIPMGRIRSARMP